MGGNKITKLCNSFTKLYNNYAYTKINFTGNKFE